MAENPESSFIALVMAGGSGTRFWPASRPDKPKQYLTLWGNRSLIQSTIDRLKKTTSPQNIYICSGKNQKKLLTEQLPEISQFILEPSGRNTAPCLMLSVATLLHQGLDGATVMGVFPADHYIGDEPAFTQTLQIAINEAQSSQCLITLGIAPSSAHTGYGYIEAMPKEPGATSSLVKQFVEKPALEQAQKYLKQGNFYWNAGIFVWRLDVIAEAFASFLPKEWNEIKSAVKNNQVDKIYNSLTQQPIDIAILEKAKNVRVIPADFKWSDVGSWNALLELLKNSQTNPNVVLPDNSQNVQLINVSDCLIATESSKKVVLIGVKDLIVVESQEGILIAHRSQDQKVKEIT